MSIGIMQEESFTSFEIQAWLPGFILGINRLRLFSGLTNSDQKKSQQMFMCQFSDQNWEHTQTKRQDIRNKSLRYTGSSYTVTKVFSLRMVDHT